MEYKLILSGPISKEVIEKTAKDWLRGSLSGQFGVGPAGVASRGIPVRTGFMLDQFRPLPGISSGRGLGTSSYPTCVAPPADSLFSSHQLMHRETTLTTDIRLTQLSEMGRGQVHTFVLNDRELLVINQAGMHHQWVRLQHGWESTHQAMAQQAVGGQSPASQSDWQRIKAAMASGVRQLPGHIATSLNQLLDSLLTWEGMLLLVAVTALFVLGGEVALLVMGAFAVYDLLMNVLPLMVEFYHAAIAARTPAQVEAAGKLFAQALLRGALDVIDVQFAAGAYRRMLVLGGGRMTLRGVMAYLAERVTLLMNRLRQGAGKLSRVIKQADEWAKKQIELHKKMKNRQSGGVNSSSEVAKDGYRTRASGVKANSRSIANTKITSEGIAKVREHLSKPRFTEEGELAANNKVMIERLEKIERGELEPTMTDKNFYEHELREKSLMDVGMEYDDAHAQACKEFGITAAKEKKGAFYTEEAIKAWDAQIKKNLGF